MAYLLENEDLLKDLFLREIIFHIVLVNSLDSDLLPSELMYAQCYLTECSLPNESYKLIEIEGRGGDLFVLLYEGFVILD